jgi:hypothetical protein
MTIDQLLQDADHVGGVFSTGYDTCDILTNDKWTQDAGGLPKHTLLIARPLLEGDEIVSEEDVHNAHRIPEDPTEFERPDPSNTESTHALLLRVTEPADIPEEGRLRTNRFDAMREAITGDESGSPSPEDFVDVLTRREMQYSGVRTTILGTFHQTKNDDGEKQLTLTSDVQTFFSAGHYIVYKPDGDALQWIASYPTTTDDHPVKLGNVRYTTTDIWGNHGDVGMYFDVNEFIGAKTAVFGMTRKGKSNTLKIIAGAIENHESGIGQLIFDPSGEYAYANDQDKECALGELHDESGKISTVYKFAADEDSERFRPLRTNLLSRSNLGVVKEYVRRELIGETADYVGRFLSTEIKSPSEIDELEGSDYNRHMWRLSAYMAVVSKAIGEDDYPEDDDATMYISVDDDVLEAINDNTTYTHEKNRYSKVPLGFYEGTNTLVDFWETVARNTRDINDAYTRSDEWVDDELDKILDMLRVSGSQSGYQKLSNLRDYHNPERDEDVAQEIYNLLADGEMVIVDISNGLEQVVKSEKERVVNKLLEESMKRFRKSGPDEELPKIQVYLEEAHQHFEEYRDEEDMNPFVILAKEGAKFEIGMTYSTQEVTSVDSRVRANTANWIVTHINSKGETNELSKYYNFEDFEESIRNVETVGYARAKTYDGEHIVPIKVSLFDTEWVRDNTRFGVKKDGESIVTPPTEED